MNSPEITRLAKALLAVQRELSPASKDATVVSRIFRTFFEAV